MLAYDELHAGRWDEAHQLVAEASDMWSERGYRLYGWTGRYARALIAANRGDRESVGDLCRRWSSGRPRGSCDAFTEWAHHALAEAALGAGDFEASYANATAISPPGHSVPTTHRRCGPRWISSKPRCTPDAPTRRGLTPRPCDAVDLGRISPRFALVTTAAQAMVAPDGDAAELFAAALALPGVDDWPFELARVRLAHGERLRRLRRTRDARSELATARDGFERLGAGPWAQRAATELAATGATRQSGIASLTPQEREIALLAATGMTNRAIATQLYMSPRTVSSHLYRIFPKLGITSRAALRDALSGKPSNA